MGIAGLLPLVKPYSKTVNINTYAGCRAAVDAYCWLHKGAISCADKLFHGQDCTRYVNYCIKYVDMLLSHNIKPVLVFDGRHLPAKAGIEKSRREHRANNREKAERLLRQNRLQEAYNAMKACIDITPEMAYKLIKRCHQLGVDCIVAPYEADVQLAYLNIAGFADVVITEDSDLLVFGCERVLFKLDLAGNGLLVEQSILPLAMKIHDDRFSIEKFRHMCILSGCDYLASLPGIGLGQARKFINNTVEMSTSRALAKWFARLDMVDSGISPSDYLEKFIRADNMFKHQPVFDPKSRQVVPLTPVPEGRPGLDFESLPDEISLQLALGNLNPLTLRKYDDWNPDHAEVQHLDKTVSSRDSIWSRSRSDSVPIYKITTNCESSSDNGSSVKREKIGLDIDAPEMNDSLPRNQIRIDDRIRHRGCGAGSRQNTLKIGGWSDEQFFKRLELIVNVKNGRDSPQNATPAYVGTNSLQSTLPTGTETDGTREHPTNHQPRFAAQDQENVTTSSRFKFIKMGSINPPSSNRVEQNDEPEDHNLGANVLTNTSSTAKQERKPKVVAQSNQPNKLQSGKLLVSSLVEFGKTNTPAKKKRDSRHYELLFGNINSSENKLPKEIQFKGNTGNQGTFASKDKKLTRSKAKVNPHSIISERSERLTTKSDSVTSFCRSKFENILLSSAQKNFSSRPSPQANMFIKSSRRSRVQSNNQTKTKSDKLSS